MPIEQEKNELRAPFNDNEDELAGKWANWRSANVKKGTPGRVGRPGGDWESKTSDNNAFFNTLPPGSDITDAEMADIRRQELTGPMGCGSQVTNDLTPQSVRDGFRRSHMSSTDEALSGEKAESFYEEVTVDGKTSFVERRNTLDRN